MTEKKKGGFWKGVRSEFKKVVWPTKKETLHYTATVAVVALLVALFCAVLDFIFSGMVGWIV